MSEQNGTFQSKADIAVQEFAALLFTYTDGHNGFDSLEKASDPSLAMRRELELGYMDDTTLAHEIDKLNGYLREEREFYQRGMHFYRILEAAKQRIQHLSGRLKRAEGKVVEQPVESFAACTQKSPMATKFDAICQEKGNVNQFKEGDVCNRPRDGKTDRPDTPPPKPTPEAPGKEPTAQDLQRAEDTLNGTYQHDTQVLKVGKFTITDDHGGGGRAVEVHPDDTPSKSAWELADDIKGPAEFIPADGAPIAQAPDVPKEFTDKFPKVVELHGRIGVIGSHTSSVLMSAAFGRKHGDVRRELMAKGDTVTRILTQFNRVAWAIGILDGDSMEDMVVKILRKYPDISSNLVLGCIEVGNPFWKTMSQKELEELLGKFHELVAIVDPKKEL